MTAVEAVPDASDPGPGTAAGEVEYVDVDFVDCYVRHYGRLVKALVLGGADRGTAEELAQEAFARALPRWNRIRRGPNPAGYLYTTGFRLLRRHLARSARWEMGEPPEPSGSRSDLTGSAASARVDVATVLAGMPIRRRACAVLCLLAGVSTGDAAEALGIATGTVRKHLEEARRDLGVLGTDPDRQGP